MQPTPTQDPTHDEEEGYRFLLPQRSGELAEFLHSRCRVEITPSDVRVRELIGPLYWTWNHAWSPETEFSITELNDRSSTRRNSAIRMLGGTREPLIAPGYSEEKLTQLVQHLRAAQIEWAPRHSSFEGEALPVSRPGKRSDIRVQHTPDGLHADIPPLGLVEGSKGLWVLGLIFCAFSIVAGSFVVLTAGSTMRGTDMAFVGMALSFFALIGALMAGIGWNMAKRRATITLDDDWLDVTRTSILGVSNKRIPRISITNVAIGPSGIVVNGAPLNELQVFSRGRKVLGMMSQRSDEDIKRLALVLNNTLSREEDDDAASNTSNTDE